MASTFTDLRSDGRIPVVFGAALTQFTVVGVLFAYGVFFKDLEAEFGWSRTLLSSCMSVAFLVMGILAIPGGRLTDRFGPRLVLGVTGTLYAIGYLLLSRISEVWHLIAIYGLFVGIGMSTHDVVTLSTITRWFDKRRGMMTGVVKVGTAIGQVVIPPFAAILILTFGWRTALVVLGLCSAVLLWAAAMLIRNPPVDKTAESTRAETGMRFAEARRSSVFWRLCAIQFLFLPTLVTVPLHIVAHAMDLGMTKTTAALLLSVTGGVSVVGRLVVGMSFDRFGGRGALVICLVPLIASLGAFMVVGNPLLLYVVVIVYGFGHGGLFTVVSPTIAEYFGTRAHGSLFGIVVFFGTIGAAAGPILAGWMFDVQHSYFWAFATLGGAGALALILALSLPRSGVARAS